MLASPQREPERSPEALRHEMDAVRADMVSALEQLELALHRSLDPKRQLALHPWAAVACAAVAGITVVLGVRRYLRSRRMRSTLAQLSSAHGRRIWIF